MNKLLKCFWCNEKDREDKAEVVNGTVKKRYHVGKCYDEYLKDQEFKRVEKEDKDYLVETIKELHNISSFPHQFYSYIEDYRNGNELFGNIGTKKFKQGYSYKTIAETYLECSNEINWALNNINFKDSLNMLKYTRRIVEKNFSKVDYKIVSRKRKQEIERATEEQAINTFEHVNRQPVEYKKKKSKNDVSDFLD